MVSSDHMVNAALVSASAARCGVCAKCASHTTTTLHQLAAAPATQLEPAHRTHESAQRQYMRQDGVQGRMHGDAIVTTCARRHGVHAMFASCVTHGHAETRTSRRHGNAGWLTNWRHGMAPRPPVGCKCLLRKMLRYPAYSLAQQSAARARARESHSHRVCFVAGRTSLEARGCINLQSSMCTHAHRHIH